MTGTYQLIIPAAAALAWGELGASNGATVMNGSVVSPEESSGMATAV